MEKLRFFALFLGLLFYQNSIAQTDSILIGKKSDLIVSNNSFELVDSFYVNEIPNGIISWNPLALLGGNIAAHFSYEKPFTETRSLEFDIKYYFASLIGNEQENNEIKPLEISTKYGFSGLITYKFLWAYCWISFYQL